MGYATRDQQGCAVKSTYVELEQVGYPEGSSPEALEPYMWTEGREIFKDPITDDGLKKSAKGRLAVQHEGINLESPLVLIQQCTEEQEKAGLLETVFLDGKLVKFQTLSEIRARLAAYTVSPIEI